MESTRYRYQYNLPHLLRVVLGKYLPSEVSANSTGRPTECVPCGLSLRHAANDATAVKPAPLMGGRGGSEVGVVVVAPVMSSAVVGRVLGNRTVEGRKN